MDYLVRVFEHMASSQFIVGFIEKINAIIQLLPFYVWLSLLVILGLLSIKRTKHYYKIQSASKALTTLRSISSHQMQFGYLRKVDPFVFEEMILTAFSQLGYKIKRNNRYTGDGGIDGRVYINGKLVLIQAKRYKGHIAKAHVEDFIRICNTKNCAGIFIHTGRTGEKTWQAAANNIDIISGQRLIWLMNNVNFDFYNI